jgi:hypothetical protein
MKARCLAGVLGVVVAASMVWAEEVAPEINTGSKGILFSFSGLNTLGAGPYYNGTVAGIGGKYYLMSPIALRATLRLGMAGEKLKTQLASGGTDGSNSAMTFGLAAGAEYHLTFARVSPFGGGEISYVATSTKNVAPINVANGPKVTTKNGGALLGYTPGNAFTIGGIGGVEFFITKEISLGAEYHLDWRLPVGYEAKVTSEGATKTETTTKVPGRTDFGITNNGMLTLAVYF